MDMEDMAMVTVMERERLKLATIIMDMEDTAMVTVMERERLKL